MRLLAALFIGVTLFCGSANALCVMGIGSCNDLTREGAATLIKGSLDNTVAVAYVKIGKLKADLDVYGPLIKQGILQGQCQQNNFFGTACDLSLTDLGKKYLPAPGTKIYRARTFDIYSCNGGCPMISLVIAKYRLQSVTGIKDLSATVKQTDYNYNYDKTPIAGLMQIEDISITSGPRIATFQKYDDGWRMNALFETSN